MYEFIKRLFYFSIPFLILMILILYIDPYNILRLEKNQELMKLKKNISSKVNYPLYSLQQYINSPIDIVILGDSRASNVGYAFDKNTNKKVSNLAYGGGSLQEVIETFWIINKIHKPKEVYIGINFNLYSELNNKNRVKESNIIRNSKVSYLLSKYSIKSTFLILKSILTKRMINIERPPFSKKEFWKYQLENVGPFFFDRYKYPLNYYNSLGKISQYCKKNGIKLVIFIPPTHIDLQAKIKEYNLESEYDKFLNDLVSLNVRIFNFNFVNEMTKNEINFRDPYHPNEAFSNIIAHIISKNKLYMERYNSVFKILK